MKRPARWSLMALCGALVAGCADDLGPCDREAALEIVYGPRYVVATSGQALMHDSCGSGAFCHSQAASADSRMGAPKSLDFDMFPRPDGWKKLLEYRDDVWTTVEDGTMPPRGTNQGTGTVGWYFDAERDEQSSRPLPSIFTAQGKEIVRNWLACDAPIVEMTYQPQLAGGAGAGASGSGGRSGTGGEAGESGGSGGMGGEDAGDAGGESDSGAPMDAAMDAELPPEPPPPDWAPIFEDIIEPTCAVAPCHDGITRAGLLQLTDPCDALEALLETSPCMNKVRIVPGDPGASYFYEKLTDEMPSCGSRMPTLGPLLPSELEQIETWIAEGAHAEACE